MDSTLLQVLGVVATIVAIIGGVAVIALYARGAFAKAAIDDLTRKLDLEQKASASYRERIEYLEQHAARSDEQMARLTAENQALRQAPQLVVDGLSDAIKDLTHLTDSRTEQIAESIDALAAGVHAHISGRRNDPQQRS